jgi:hypothetical protein
VAGCQVGICFIRRVKRQNKSKLLLTRRASTARNTSTDKQTAMTVGMGLLSIDGGVGPVEEGGVVVVVCGVHSQ